MGSFTSKLTSEERFQLETAAKEKHVALIISSLEHGDPICVKFIDLLQPLCNQLSVLRWSGKQLLTSDGSHDMNTIRSAQKIILVHVRSDSMKAFTMLAGDTMFAGLYNYLQHNIFDINSYGRLVCCHISNNAQVSDSHYRQPDPSDIWTALIKRQDYIVTAIFVNIPFTRRWGSLEESEAAIEHLLMALEIPLTETPTTMEPFRKILTKRVYETE